MTPVEKPPEPRLLILGLVPRSWDRYPTGRDQADHTAHWVWRHVLGTVTHRAGPRLTTQPKSSRAQRGGFFFRRQGKSAPVGVRTPHLRVPLVAPRPTELTTLGISIGSSCSQIVESTISKTLPGRASSVNLCRPSESLNMSSVGLLPVKISSSNMPRL